MKRSLFILLFAGSLLKGAACPTSYFHIITTGTQTFYFENMNNPSDHLTVTTGSFNSIDAWDFSSTLSNPCGMKFGSNTCYKIYRVGAPATAQAAVIVFKGGNPNHLTLNYDLATESFTVSNPGNTSAYLLSFATIANPPPCPLCNSDLVIIDNYLVQDNTQTYPGPATLPLSYLVTLTQSGTFIQIFTSLIAAGTTVKMDAHPVNGYILLGEGFETQPGAVFLAQSLDGCGPLVPQ